MSNPTPGPWAVGCYEADENGCSIIAINHDVGFESPTRGMVAWCTTVIGAAFKSPETAEANAKLIAAAPDLYEALRELLLAVQKSVCENSGAAQDKAYAALAKAEGAA